jgi:hypothetical protein
MLSWGTDYYHFGEVSTEKKSECAICKAQRMEKFTGEQGNFKFMGLPLFMTSTNYYRVCNSCNVRFKLKKTDTDYSWVSREIPKKAYFSYYWGWFILIGVVGCFLYIVKPWR